MKSIQSASRNFLVVAVVTVLLSTISSQVNAATVEDLNKGDEVCLINHE